MAKNETKFIFNKCWEDMLVSLGLERKQVLRRASLPDDLFGGQYGLNNPEYFRLWSTIESMCPVPGFPIQVIENIRNEVFEPPIFAAYCSPNFDIALNRLCKFKPLVGPMEIRVEKSLERTKMEIIFTGDSCPPLPPSLAGVELAFYVQLVRMATQERVCPLEVTSPVALGADEEYQDFFGVLPKRGKELSLTFSAVDTLRPFLSENNRMWDFFEPELRSRLSELTREEGTSARVRSCLVEMLPSGQSSVEALASRLMVSRRTLQRRLKDEGTNFKSVLSDLRKDLASHYITQSELSYNEISLLLGYEEPNSFFRAFHSWTGKTPDSVRQASRV